MPPIQPQRSMQRQGDKRQRRSRRNRVTRTVAKWFAQSTSEWPKTLPRGSNGGRSPLGLSFSPIFLQTKKDGAPGGPSEKRMYVKPHPLQVSSPKEPFPPCSIYCIPSKMKQSMKELLQNRTHKNESALKIVAKLRINPRQISPNCMNSEKHQKNSCIFLLRRL